MAQQDRELEKENMIAAAELFHAFSDSSRLRIVHHLLQGEHRVGELVDHLGLSQSTVSQHLIRLKEAGVVTSRAEGRASVYSVVDAPQVTKILTSVEEVLALHGRIVELCPTHNS